MKELVSCECEDMVRKKAEARLNAKLPKTLFKGQVFSCFNEKMRIAIVVKCECDTSKKDS